MSTTGTTNTASTTGLTLDMLHGMLDSLVLHQSQMSELRKVAPLSEEPWPGLLAWKTPFLYGMRVFQSPLAKFPTRKHKRRKWMSIGYHLRIQKKWNKRFGYQPAAFAFDSSIFNINMVVLP